MLLNQLFSTKGYESPACTFISLTAQEIVCQSGIMSIEDMERDGENLAF